MWLAQRIGELGGGPGTVKDGRGRIENFYIHQKEGRIAEITDGD